MTSTPPSPPAGDPVERLWREVLTHGHRGRWAFLPAGSRSPNPRCSVCEQPFVGISGRFLKALTGYRRSHASPNVCNLCEEGMPTGGAEVDTAVFFADVRGSTGLGEQLGPAEFAALLNRFYSVSQRVILESDGWIDKLVGDEVMALYVNAMGADYRARAVESGVRLLRHVGYDGEHEPWLPVGIGVHAGLAYVGKVGPDGTNQFTAIGDTVNTAARLQSMAGPGELLISEEIYRAVAARYPDLERRTLAVRGRTEPIDVRVLRPAELPK